MNRKSIVLSLLGLSLTVAAGCSPNTSEKGASPGTSSQTSANKVKLTVTSWRAEQTEQDLYKLIQQELNKTHPEIELDFKPVKATEYNTTLNTALKTDTAADIIHLRPYAAGKALADAGYFEPAVQGKHPASGSDSRQE